MTRAQLRSAILVLAAKGIKFKLVKNEQTYDLIFDPRFEFVLLQALGIEPQATNRHWSASRR